MSQIKRKALDNGKRKEDEATKRIEATRLEVAAPEGSKPTRPEGAVAEPEGTATVRPEGSGTLERRKKKASRRSTGKSAGSTESSRDSSRDSADGGPRVTSDVPLAADFDFRGIVDRDDPRGRHPSARATPTSSRASSASSMAEGKAGGGELGGLEGEDSTSRPGTPTTRPSLKRGAEI